MTNPGVRRVIVLRRTLVWLIVASFGVAAVLGIAVLLAGELGETANRVLVTTVTIGAFSVAVLCGATLLGRPPQAVGIAGVVVSILTAGYFTALIWNGSSMRDWGDGLRLQLTGVAATAALSLASLLLLLGGRRRPFVRVGLLVTLGLIALLLALTVYLVWSDESGDAFMRLYGIVAILTALGAIVVPVSSLLLPDTSRPHASGVDPVLAARLTAAAERRGITMAELVAPVLAADEPPGPRADV